MSSGAVTRLPITSDVQIAGARQAVREAAVAAGFSLVEQTKIVTAASELARNTLVHGGGHMELTTVGGPERSGIRLTFVDTGPGIPDVTAALSDGYTTASSLGGGLGACRRGASQFDLYSRPGEGTVVLARVGPGAAEPSGMVEVGGLITPHPDESAVGDGYGLAWEQDRMTVGVVDGLGHGVAAAEARRAALDVLEQQPTLDSVGLLRELDTGLRVTRGAAAAIAQIDMWSRQLTFAGLGNVTGRLYRPGASQTLVSRPGILGAGQQPRLHRLVSADWKAPAVLVMHTDGINSRWDPADYPGADRYHPAIMAALIWRDAKRGNDDATVVVVRTRPDEGVR